jgi:hypothetical protein
MSEVPADTDSPLSPAAAFALLGQQQRTVARRLGGSVRVITAVWGVAWLVGFLAIWLMDGGVAGLALPTWLGWTIFAAMFAAAIVASAFLGIRSGRGIRSNSANAFTGTVYGVTWALSMLSINVLGAALFAHGMSLELADLFYPSAYALVVGVMYLAAAAIWRVVQLIVAGAWMIVLAVIVPFFGHPTNYLIFAIAGGVLFFVLAIASTVRGRTADARG